MAKKVGRDTSIIPLMVGPFGIGIPKWLGLVVVYFAVVFALGWGVEDGFRAATLFAAMGPGLIGLVDLVLRLRTTHYHWVNGLGVEVVNQASLVDRLTFQECGWYLPVLNLTLPLWLVGMGLSAVFTHSWGVFTPGS